MSKLFKNVQVDMRTDYFDIEISDEELELYKEVGIDISNTENLITTYLEDNFQEYVNLLNFEDIYFEEEEEE